MPFKFFFRLFSLILGKSIKKIERNVLFVDSLLKFKGCHLIQIEL